MRQTARCPIRPWRNALIKLPRLALQAKRGSFQIWTADTPDSVSPCGPDNHYSRRPTWSRTRVTYGPAWPCSVRGLPCRVCYQTRGALLPHLFTLTLRRYIFCGTFRRISYLTRPPFQAAHCPVESGSSSLALAQERLSGRPFILYQIRNRRINRVA